MRKWTELSKVTLNDIDFEFTEKQTNPVMNEAKIHCICDETWILEYGLKWVM